MGMLVLALLGAVACDFSSEVPPTPVPIRLRLFDGNSCNLAGFPQRLTFRIDPLAAEQVTAVDQSAAVYEVWWPEGFRGGTSDEPVVRDPLGRVVVRNGQELPIPERGFPNLQGYSVCSGGGETYPAIWVQLRTISIASAGARINWRSARPARSAPYDAHDWSGWAPMTTR